IKTHTQVTYENLVHSTTVLVLEGFHSFSTVFPNWPYPQPNVSTSGNFKDSFSIFVETSQTSIFKGSSNCCHSVTI
ncbi:unnamed protein product, partial [Sphagnum jensenii]